MANCKTMKTELLDKTKKKKFTKTAAFHKNCDERPLARNGNPYVASCDSDFETNKLLRFHKQTVRSPDPTSKTK